MKTNSNTWPFNNQIDLNTGLFWYSDACLIYKVFTSFESFRVRSGIRTGAHFLRSLLTDIWIRVRPFYTRLILDCILQRARTRLKRARTWLKRARTWFNRACMRCHFFIHLRSNVEKVRGERERRECARIQVDFLPFCCARVLLLCVSANLTVWISWCVIPRIKKQFMITI